MRCVDVVWGVADQHTYRSISGSARASQSSDRIAFVVIVAIRTEQESMVKVYVAQLAPSCGAHIAGDQPEGVPATDQTRDQFRHARIDQRTRLVERGINRMRKTQKKMFLACRGTVHTALRRHLAHHIRIGCTHKSQTSEIGIRHPVGSLKSDAERPPPHAAGVEQSAVDIEQKGSACHGLDAPLLKGVKIRG